MSQSSPENDPSAPPPNWEALAERPEFHALLRDKARFVIPATIFFVVYYFALLILVGYYPELMKKKCIGPMNWAYAFALSQFFMAWFLAFLYMRVAARWDREAAAVIATEKND